MSARRRRRAAQAIAAAIAALACAPAAQAYELDGIPWPGRPATVTYWNGTAYGAQVAQAARAWNESGARVRLRRASRARAQLLIVDDPRTAVGENGLAHGFASVGYQPRNRIAIGRGAQGVGVVGLIAHEFGHVLGLVHDDRRCAQPGRDAVALVQPGEAPVLFPAGTGPATVAVGDLTGDGRPDVVTAPADPATWLMLANRGLPRASVAPASVDAGAQAPGTIGAPRAITVTAQDTARLRVGTATATGTGRLDHLVTDDCAGAVLEPGQSCTIATRFAPSADGVRDATLSIPTSAGTQVVTLTGRGAAPPAGGGQAGTTGRASLTCKVVKVKGRARRGVDCRATLSGVTGARRLSARLTRGRTTLASATAAPGGTLKLRPRKALAKGSVSVALTVTTSGAAVTARRAVTVR